MTAYNYKSQEWVEGAEGTKLRLAQLREELALLRSPQGEEYVKMIGTKGLLPSLFRARAIKSVERQIALAELEEVRESQAPRGWDHVIA